MDKQLSLLHHWRLQNVRQDKHLFSTTFVGRNSHCDVINALCPKPVIFDNEINSIIYSKYSQTCLSHLRWYARVLFSTALRGGMHTFSILLVCWYRSIPLAGCSLSKEPSTQLMGQCCYRPRWPKNCDCALCKYVLYHTVVSWSYVRASPCLLWFMCRDCARLSAIKNHATRREISIRKKKLISFTRYHLLQSIRCIIQ